MSYSKVTAEIVDQPGIMDMDTIHDMVHRNHGVESSNIKIDGMVFLAYRSVSNSLKHHRHQ